MRLMHGIVSFPPAHERPLQASSSPIPRIRNNSKGSFTLSLYKNIFYKNIEAEVKKF